MNNSRYPIRPRDVRHEKPTKAVDWLVVIVLAVLAALALAFCFTGCTDKSSNPLSPARADVPTTVPCVTRSDVATLSCPLVTIR